MPIMCENSKIKLLSADGIKKIYCQNSVIFSTGNMVTYATGNGTYKEDVEEGATCLAPKTFTPTLSGWTFIGWRADQTASGVVLDSLIMGEEPVTLYAVFRQTITLSYAGNGATGGSTANQTGYRYYNNGNVANPSFTVRANGFARSGYIFTGWKSGSTAYTAGQSVTLSANLVLTAQWYTAAATYFAYTGGIQSWKVPVSGLYLLTCKGAEGGNNPNGYLAGKGGITRQYVMLAKDTTIYICCGGTGSAAWDDSVPGGYNGAGKGHSSGNWWAASGGGCTHIAMISGTLYAIGTSRKSQVLAVAGGGGGSTTYGNGGDGGGTTGVSTPYGSAGTQTSGYAFGLGGPPKDGGGGTGGGLYGGVGNSTGALGGSGGSGYISSAATTFKGKTYANSTVQGGNTGNGSASIQLIAS